MASNSASFGCCSQGGIFERIARMRRFLFTLDRKCLPLAYVVEKKSVVVSKVILLCVVGYETTDQSLDMNCTLVHITLLALFSA